MYGETVHGVHAYICGGVVSSEVRLLQTFFDRRLDASTAVYCSSEYSYYQLPHPDAFIRLSWDLRQRFCPVCKS